MTESGAGTSDGDTPWVETPEGGWFFVNAVLVAPELIVLFPLASRTTLRMLGLVRGPSVFLDTVPWVAGHVVPYVGWLLVIPIWATIKNLGIATGRVRVTLFVFLGLHVSFLGYAALRWVGVLPAPG